MCEIESSGIFSGSINGKEVNIASTTRVNQDRVVIEHRSMDGKRGRKDEIKDRQTATTIAYLVRQQEQVADAEAYRQSPCTPIFKESSPKTAARSFTYCPDCDGTGWLDGDECPACQGDGWRAV